MNKYDQSYYRGEEDGEAVRKGSDLVHRFDSHWWSNRFYSRLCRSALGRSGGARLLELGSAHGYILQSLSARFETYGLDLSEYAVGVCHDISPRSEVVVTDIESGIENAFEGKSFDCILAKYVLEHLADPGAVIQACHRRLNDGGTLIFSVPNTSSLLRKCKGGDWIGTRDTTHVSLLRPEEWYAHLTSAGFLIRKAFSDGFWDVPYLKGIPAVLQLPVFGCLSMIEILTCIPFIPVRWGENLIVIAQKARDTA